MSDEREPLLEVLTARRSEFAEYLRRRTRTTMDAEDVLQQAFLVATRKVEAVRDPAAVVGWFYQILRTTVADYHERLTAKGVVEMTTDEPSVMPPYDGRTCACSLALLDTLPPQYADILRRVDVLEEAVEGVAEALGLTLNNATVRLHRARKALRERLAEFCGTTSPKECLNCRCATGSA